MTDAASAPLGALAAATITVPDLDGSITAYSEFLGYGVRERGTVPDSLARSWGAPAAPGHLPPGVAMVSFRCHSLRLGPAPVAPPARASVLPYAGASSVMVTGRNGERFELIESPSL